MKTLRIDNIWNFATLNLYTVPAKILISKDIQPIFEFFASARRYWGRAFGWKVSYAQVFYFCNGRVKTLRIDNIWNLRLSTCTLCHQKSNISKDIKPIFEFFASARRCWASAFGWKVSGVHVFYICNGKVKTFRFENIWNFATHNLYTVPAKILYLRTYSTDFRNLCLSSKILREGIWVKSLICAGILLLQWQSGNLGASTTFEILPLSTCTLCQQKSYISKGIQPIFEIFASARRYWGSAFVWKVSYAQVFYFCHGRVKILRIDNIWNFFYFQPVHCACKNPISPKIFNRFSKSLPPLEDNWGWAFGCKVSGAQIFYPCKCMVKTLRIDKIWNFGTFNLYTVPAKILYLQRYSTDFRILRLSSKILREGIWVKSFICAGILRLQWQSEKFGAWRTFEILPLSTCTLCQQKSSISKGIQPIFEIFASSRRYSGRVFGWKVSYAQVFYFCNDRVKTLAHRQHLKFCNSQPVHCASKNPISPKIFNRFSKSFVHSKMLGLGIWVGSLSFAGILLLKWLVKVSASITFEILLLSTGTLCQHKSYISEDIQPIFEIFASARRCWGVHLGGNFQLGRYFTFAMESETLRIDNIWNFASFNLYTVPAKILYLQRYSTNFRTLSLSSKMLRVGIWVGSLSFAGILLLKWLVKVSASITFEILLLSTGTLCQHKSYISKDIQPIFEIFASKDVEGRHWS